MPDHIELVRRHLDAVASFDWRTVEASMTDDADLSLEGVADRQWSAANLYRSISQAWDFAISQVDLLDARGDAVTGVIVLLNDGWRKEIACEYRVTSGLISSVAFSDSALIDTTTA